MRANRCAKAETCVVERNVSIKISFHRYGKDLLPGEGPFLSPVNVYRGSFSSPLTNGLYYYKTGGCKEPLRALSVLNLYFSWFYRSWQQGHCVGYVHVVSKNLPWKIIPHVIEYRFKLQYPKVTVSVL